MICVGRVHYQLLMCFHLINKKFFCISIVYKKLRQVKKIIKIAYALKFVLKKFYVNQNIEALLIQDILLAGNAQK
jgi:hypothetical protein